MNPASPVEEEALRNTSPRGDKTRRRRDVLEAAAAILDEKGWDGLSIRGVAGRAGVSAGAVYQWFSGKDEIFAELYTAKIIEGIGRLEELGTDVTLDDLLMGMVEYVLGLWSELGRYHLEFFELSSGREGRTAVTTLVDRNEELSQRANTVLEQIAARDGVALRSSRHRITWLWAACIGVSERVIAMRLDRDADERAAFLQYSRDSIRQSLVAA